MTDDFSSVRFVSVHLFNFCRLPNYSKNRRAKTSKYIDYRWTCVVLFTNRFFLRFSIYRYVNGQNNRTVKRTRSMLGQDRRLKSKPSTITEWYRAMIDERARKCFEIMGSTRKRSGIVRFRLFSNNTINK